jgi:DNA-binding MarR family transcriptional regulator
MAKRPSTAAAPTAQSQPVSQAEFEALAAFRLELRRYLAFAQRTAQARGVTMEQHQAMLAIRASENRYLPTGRLAELLFLKPHSAVELIDRLVKLGLVERRKDSGDGRRTLVALTDAGEAILQELAAGHLVELRAHGSDLARALRKAAARP